MRRMGAVASPDMGQTASRASAQKTTAVASLADQPVHSWTAPWDRPAIRPRIQRIYRAWMPRDGGAHPPGSRPPERQLTTIGITSGFLRSLPPPVALFEAPRSGRRHAGRVFPPAGFEAAPGARWCAGVRPPRAP